MYPRSGVPLPVGKFREVYGPLLCSFLLFGEFLIGKNGRCERRVVLKCMIHKKIRKPRAAKGEHALHIKCWDTALYVLRDDKAGATAVSN